ncbi:winged helix-turn-helix transcriptional regulator [archaeon]|jgi:predicted transcriptional regulator|nr:winged helix-turn-helix transcriptional regulator [archaeon]
MAKRNKLEIIRDILTIVRDNRSVKPTPLLRKSNLSSSRFKGYYSDLLEKGFVRETLGGNKQISLTKKGQKYLEKYSIIISFIDEFEL